MSEQIRSTAFDDGYGRGPRELIRDANLSPAARLLWVILEDMTSALSPQPFPGQDTLAEWVGCTPRHVRNLLQELINREWLEVTRRGTNKTNLYTLKRPGQVRNSSSKADSDRNSSSGPDRKQSSGPDRNSSSYEAKPVEAEPVEAPTTTNSYTNSGPQPEPPKPRGSRKKTPTAIHQKAMTALGYPPDRTPKPNKGTLAILKHALNRGHTPDDLTLLAWTPPIQNARNPQAALHGAWRKHANTNPTPPNRQRQPFDWDNWIPPEERDHPEQRWRTPPQTTAAVA